MHLLRPRYILLDAVGGRLIVDPGTGGVYTFCIRDRNNSQEPESEARDRNKSDQEGTMKEINNPRKNNSVEYSKN